MARRYAVGPISGLSGQIETHVGGVQIDPGDPLPEGTTTFTVLYWYDATPADVAAGALPGQRLSLVIADVPVSLSNADLRLEIMRARADKRDTYDFGSDPTELIFQPE